MNEWNNSDGTNSGEQRRRAAMYVRMSTDHQKYSTENQADAIRDYAARRQMDIVKTYADSGKSGLSLDGRDALQNLIADVQSGQAEKAPRREFTGDVGARGWRVRGEALGIRLGKFGEQPPPPVDTDDHTPPSEEEKEQA